MTRAARLGLALAALSVLAVVRAEGARAHESRPLQIELIEVAPATFRLAWRAPPSLAPSTTPRLAMPDPCRPVAPGAADGLSGQALYQCEDDPSGQALEIVWPGYNPSVSALIAFERASGESHISLLGPERTRWIIPPPETPTKIAGAYTRLGVRHILEGADHLVFLACLIWIARTWRRLLVTISGFTLAHSITLSLAALDIVRLPVPPVEAAIALSIVFLATEIVKGPRDTLTWRRPIAVSSTFGLLHGLGFAAVLGEIGLPQTQLLTGLVFFNIGVEIGQVLFVAALWPILLGGSAALRRFDLGAVPVSAARAASGYAVGILAAYWMVERVAGFLA